MNSSGEQQGLKTSDPLSETPGLKEQAALDEAPPYIPRDILTREERAWDGQLIGAFWIRTWFGRKDDQESRDAADAAYKRLFVTVMQEGDDNQSNEVLQEELISDNQ
ncbi:hypothetical protein N7499_002186 [Penicillium canescens]|nr:hypothetical protein N7499_002186 [Penicillium canescens]KAJ6165801.1 hypothetical protein N7485_009045 [Penicillium canescens]